MRRVPLGQRTTGTEQRLRRNVEPTQLYHQGAISLLASPPDSSSHRLAGCDERELVQVVRHHLLICHSSGGDVEAPSTCVTSRSILEEQMPSINGQPVASGFMVNGQPVSNVRVVPPDERARILIALGELSLAASIAERFVGQALYLFLTDDPDADGAGRTAKGINGMAKLAQVLSIALPDDVSVRTILADAGEYLTRIAAAHSSIFCIEFDNTCLLAELACDPTPTPVTFFNRIQARYQRRNESLHAFELDTTVTPHRLWKNHEKKGQEQVSVDELAKVCTSPPADKTLPGVYAQLTFELNSLSRYLPTIAAASRWWLRENRPNVLSSNHPR